jgi:hypothetical protein
MRDDFLDSEIALIERYDKKLKKKVVKKFPMVGGRLRLFHLDLELKAVEGIAGGIDTSIHKYDGELAIVEARACYGGNAFTGIGMASKSRDATIYPAILELAETRAIARALRFAGFGVEFTGAEEMSGVKSFAENSKVASEVVQEKEETETKVEPSEEDESPDHGSEESGITPKREVWDFIKESFPEIEDSVLAKTMQIFVKKTLQKNDGQKEDFVYNAVLKNKSAFIRTFSVMIIGGEKKEAPKEEKTSPRDRDELKKRMEALSEEKKVKPEEKVDTSERNLKGQIYMSMPDGCIVGALNNMLDKLVEENPANSKQEIYSMIIQDMGSFIEVFTQYCKDSDIETGLEVEDTATDPVEKKDEDSSTGNEYSELRKEFINLGWKSFKLFIIQQANRLHESREDYDAAVEKYDRLKVKNGEAEMCFPYLFDHSQIDGGLDNQESVIKDEVDKPVEVDPIKTMGDASMITQIKASYPNMCVKVSEVTGISSETDDPKEMEQYIDEFEHQITTYEAKTGKQYKE